MKLLQKKKKTDRDRDVTFLHLLILSSVRRLHRGISFQKNVVSYSVYVSFLGKRNDLGDISTSDNRPTFPLKHNNSSSFSSFSHRRSQFYFWDFNLFSMSKQLQIIYRVWSSII